VHESCSARDSGLPEPIPWRGVVGPVKPLGLASPERSAQEAENGPDPSSQPVPRKRGRERDARGRARVLVWMRRGSQVAFLGVFLWLLSETAFRGTFRAGAGQLGRLPWPVEAFFWFDPYAALLTLLSTRVVYWGLAWSLVTLGLTLIFGRAFCGWVCPLGTLSHVAAWVWPSRRLRGKQRIQANRPRAWQNAKYYLLAACLAAALALGPLEGSVFGGIFDPICLALRGLGLGVWPLAQYLALRLVDAAGATGVKTLVGAADSVEDWLASHVFTREQFYYQEAGLMLGVLFAVLLVARLIPRFWCRALCPLGALLGTASRLAPFGMEKQDSRCDGCNLCLLHCQGADSPEGGVKHRQHECHLCFNCQAACPQDVIAFRFMPDRLGSTSSPDLDRRAVALSMAAGAVAVPAMRIGTWPDRGYDPKVIRPPGAVEERSFLSRCIRCAECMKVCPNNALHPALLEAGLEGLWTPILIPRIGYCELSCVLCGQVCPTGAIRKIDEKARLGVPPIKLGLAAIDRGRCLPWGMSVPCIVCEEFCPTSPKAIWVEEIEAPKRASAYGRDGSAPAMQSVRLKRPYVDPELCVGCGACEKVCPVVDRPAIYVTSVGESRSKTNVMLLPGAPLG
jgi:polyferredoxin